MSVSIKYATTVKSVTRLINPIVGKLLRLHYNITMSLIVIGSVAYDGVETPHGTVDRMLGGAATYISLASSYFTKVGIVGVVGDDFAQEDHDLLVSHEGTPMLEK